MAILDWALVVFGVAVTLTGSWIQLNPERIYPLQGESWQRDPAAISQIRLLGGCFVFMGAFFALQMTIDLIRQPWWMGTLSGLGAAISAVALVHAQARRQQRERCLVQQDAPAEKPLEVR
jgi:hypothetical protein